MKKILVTMMALALTIAAQAQQDDGLDAMLAAMIAAKIHQDSIDTSSLVAVYNYECQTQDADGKAVTDRMKVCVQVGQHCTRSYPYRKFREDTEGYESLAPDNLPLLATGRTQEISRILAAHGLSITLVFLRLQRLKPRLLFTN
jgi:hypothetical protein